jgi:hypothetical protein
LGADSGRNEHAAILSGQIARTDLGQTLGAILALSWSEESAKLGAKSSRDLRGVDAHEADGKHESAGDVPQDTAKQEISKSQRHQELSLAVLAASRELRLPDRTSSPNIPTVRTPSAQSLIRSLIRHGWLDVTAWLSPLNPSLAMTLTGHVNVHMK